MWWSGVGPAARGPVISCHLAHEVTRELRWETDWPGPAAMVRHCTRRLPSRFAVCGDRGLDRPPSTRSRLSHWSRGYWLPVFSGATVVRPPAHWCGRAERKSRSGLSVPIRGAGRSLHCSRTSDVVTSYSRVAGLRSRRDQCGCRRSARRNMDGIRGLLGKAIRRQPSLEAGFLTRSSRSGSSGSRLVTT